MQNIILGTIMIVIGIYFLISAIVAMATKKAIPPYSWLMRKSALLFKGYTNVFYIVVAIILIVLGSLWMAGIIWTATVA